MKKIFFLLFILATASAQWDDCPFGEVNDSYPGDCGRYIDTNDDGICDHSQPEPENEGSSEETSPLAGGEQSNENSSARQTQKASARYYNFPMITGILLFLYAVSWGLSKKGKLTLASHRKIWNIALLLTFLVSGLLGILLVLRISHGIAIVLPFNTLFLHVEAGIAMAIISFFHVAWHWPYFKALIS